MPANALSRAGLTLGVAVAMLAGCARDSGDSALADDSLLTRDLSLAAGDTTALPELTDVPAEAPPPVATTPNRPPASRSRATPPRTTPPAPVPAPVPTTPPATSSGNTVEKGPGTPERASGTVTAGSILNLDAVDKVCTNTNQVGDRFTAVVKEAVPGSNGVTIPSGATVNIELTQLKRSENSNDQIVMGFRVISVSFDGRTYPLDADVQTATIDRVRASSGSNDAKKVVGGAVAGAIIGKVLGKSNKGTLIGAAAGAAAGGAAAAATADYEGCVSPGADIVVRLNSAITVVS
ncbi:MAG: hypothetical protein ACT4OZ_11805 [Gemmatimonadota bacterium]